METYQGFDLRRLQLRQVRWPDIVRTATGASTTILAIAVKRSLRGTWEQRKGYPDLAKGS